MSHTISFVIASLNDAAIVQTITSVLEVASPADQIVIKDGGSTDDTVALAENTLIEFNNATIVTSPDQGIYDAWNQALNHVQGDWVVFLGCGDRLRPDYREKISAAMTNNPEANFIHHQAQFYRLANEQVVVGLIYGKKLDKTEFKRRMRICHVGAAHKASLFIDLRFSTSYQCVSDYYFLLQKLDELAPVFIPEVLVDMEETGISSRVIFRNREELRMKLAHGQSKPITLRLWFVWSTLKSLIHKLLHSVLPGGVVTRR